MATLLSANNEKRTLDYARHSVSVYTDAERGSRLWADKARRTTAGGC